MISTCVETTSLVKAVQVVQQDPPPLQSDSSCFYFGEYLLFRWCACILSPSSMISSHQIEIAPRPDEFLDQHRLHIPHAPTVVLVSHSIFCMCLFMDRYSGKIVSQTFLHQKYFRYPQSQQYCIQHPLYNLMSLILLSCTRWKLAHVVTEDEKHNSVGFVVMSSKLMILGIFVCDYNTS